MDGWPQFSDAVVDYYFERKLAYEFIKRAQEPLCLVIREEEDRSLVLVAVNDTREECRVQYCVSDVQSNEVIAAGEAIASADSAVVLSCLPCPGSESGMYRIRWTYAGTTGMNHFLYGRTTHDLGTYRRLLSESYSTADAVSVEAPSWD
jgi:beta-mannosidase